MLALMVAMTTATVCWGQDLQLNDLEYFERQGVNVLVFSNSFNGGFNDEKNSGIEIIHHGVRTVQGGGCTTEQHAGAVGSSAKDDQQNREQGREKN